MKRISVALAAGFCIAALCAAQNSQAVDLSNFRQEGIASWYGTEFDGRPTASGELFNSSLYTAAHPTLPFGTQLTVTNLNNGRRVNVRVNDRGPFVASRIIDISQAAAQMLDMLEAGTAPVLIEAQGGSMSYNQGDGNRYQAETSTQALSGGGYSNATSQIIAPPYPPPPSPEPVIIQAQPPQSQQINQYFQQPAPAPPPPARQQVQELPPARQIQPVQQVLPVQQIQQPVQPLIQPVIISQPVQPAPQPVPQAPAQIPAPVPAPAPAPSQEVQPVQIRVPIEVKPMVTAEPVVSPAAAAPPVSVAIKPNSVYRVQVGSYKEARNALSTFERLKNAGLCPVYERHGDYFRVVLSGIPSEEVSGVLQKVSASGFRDPLLRRER